MKLTPDYVQEVSAVLAPEFAPLPKPFLEHLLNQDSRYLVLPTHVKNSSSASGKDQYLEQIWQSFLSCRKVIYTYLYAFAMAEQGEIGQHLAPSPSLLARDEIQDGQNQDKEDRITTGWLLKRLQAYYPQKATEDQGEMDAPEEAYTPSMQMISDWHKRGLLRNSEWGTPKVNSAAAILIMRSMLKKLRNWLPSTMDADEPDYWVWSLIPHQSTPTPFPMPLTDAADAHTFLWSSYPLVALDDKWVLFHKRGAFRWAGTCHVYGQTLWDLSMESMRAWGSCAHIPVGFPQITRLVQLEDQENLLPLTPEERLTNRRMSLHPIADDLLTRIGIPLLADHLQRFYASGSLALPDLIFGVSIRSLKAED